ncbi:1-phosphofructokinase [Virgibacillus halophilus]|uniref:1-phosphofructokinase n=1 Tax=Tigheibacillus halophilus TaxID=361280 RepID=UPI00363628BC
MIFTCTMTPSVDYTTYLTDFTAGTINRSNEVYYYPGGKGINVSRVLKRLGIANTAYGFIGGFTGDFIQGYLQKEGIQTDFIKIPDTTRINVKVKADTETELNGPGPELSEKNLEALKEKVDCLQKGDWFVLAGRLPETADSYFYEKIAAICRKNSVPLVLDTSGPMLKRLINEKPFLIKPNLEELGELFDVSITDKQQAIGYAKKLLDTGVSHVVVSMGGDGAILICREGVFFAQAPKGKAVNTVGAGDSLLAGFLAAYVKSSDIRSALQYGVASGSATAFAIDLCEKKHADILAEEVIVMKQNEGCEA